MLTSPRVIAIDDREDHLRGLVDGLNRLGVACLGILYSEDETRLREFSDVRVVFADLHLGGGVLGSDPTTAFSVIGHLLEDVIRPSGPYLMLLWTMYPDLAEDLDSFLKERLEGVSKPFAVRPLAKADHLGAGGAVRDPDALTAAITAATQSLPPMGVLFDWESRVLTATGRTVSSVLDVAARSEGDSQAKEVGRVLSSLASGAVGAGNVARDRFRAVNKGLLPILADRIASLRSETRDSDPWQTALGGAGSGLSLSQAEAARLNGLVQIDAAVSSDSTERGSVIELPPGLKKDFEAHFSLNEEAVASKHFRCEKLDITTDSFRWVLVQCQAACDYAQLQAGSLPWYLGAEYPAANLTGGTVSPSLWVSPVFESGGEIRHLCVSARFPVSVPSRVVQDLTPVYRLREQILNDLIYRLHSHGARPGMLSFREG